MKSSRSTSGMGGKKSSSSKKSGSRAHSMHIKRGHKGGFIAVHHPKPGEMGEDQEHPLSSMDDLHAHLDQAMGDQPPMESAAPAPAPAPAGPAGPSPAPQGM